VIKIIKNKLKLNSNSRIVLINTISTYLVKGGSIFVGFFTTPVFLRYFSNQSALGVWFTLLSILSWVLNFDLGIGNGLRNKIAITLTKGDAKATQKYISSAYIFLGLLGVLITLILLICSRMISWNKFLNISENDLNPSVLLLAVNFVILGIMMQFVLRLITSILYAMQKSFIPNLLALITNILMLLFALYCNLVGSNNNIIKLAVAYLVSLNLPLIITTIVVFSTTLRKSIPSVKYFDKKHAMETLKTGGVFLLIQLFKMFITSTNMILIAKMVSANMVVEFNIYQKVFSLISTLAIIGTTPIWSAVTRAAALNDYQWIKRITIIMYKLIGVVTVCQLLMMPIMQTFMDVWLGAESIKVNYLIMLFFIFDAIIIIWSGINASICNGLNELKVQVITMGVGAVIKIPLSYLCVKLFGSYVGIIFAHSISLAPYCVFQTKWLARYIKEKLSETSTKLP
jgi:O-antigen/teichoic acid export membrane protein